VVPFLAMNAGGDKKLQRKDIEKAIQYWNAYLSGVDHE
jgi:putative component of toxin-antitoxin plasmid stabilization module